MSSIISSVHNMNTAMTGTTAQRPLANQKRYCSSWLMTIRRHNRPQVARHNPVPPDPVPLNHRKRRRT
ncbi:hypothetical protein BC936DRAFT_137303 [Jimgerdemannia flammicorona]|uniref:Uncharacterized protein n=1 Tax=Jimgerdemannia flammicorona TaxID=994334 RepID=A0A433DJ32_9FUNG|nr:hypothetical protein BC936DRAFT_137303 [Jimgerdemannia flammicorona]